MPVLMGSLLDLSFEEQDATCNQGSRKSRQDGKVQADAGKARILQQ
jgi:hypothetical protein